MTIEQSNQLQYIYDNIKNKNVLSGILIASCDSAGGNIAGYASLNITVDKNTKIEFNGGSWTCNDSSISSGYVTINNNSIIKGSLSSGTGNHPSRTCNYFITFNYIDIEK